MADEIAPQVRYSRTIARRICDLMADGFSLSKVCQLPDMPNESSVFRWIRRYPEFLDMYNTAREALLMHWEREIQEIADNCPAERDCIRRAQLQIDSRKWLLAKLRPKKFGDRVELAGDPNAPLEVRVVRFGSEQMGAKALPAAGLDSARTGLPPSRPVLASQGR